MTKLPKIKVVPRPLTEQEKPMHPNRQTALVRNPVLEGGDGGFLPGKGTEVPGNIYWLRRIKFGDVIDVVKTKSEKQTKPAKG